MTGIPGSNAAFWEQQGQALSPLLDDVYATVIAGSDTDAAASIAIAIARVQGSRRRVAIADLVGECPPLESLLTGDDPHGVSDSFLYGVSLNKIARPIDDGGSIFLMPSGTESVANEAVYANDRWRRLAAGFHQVGALLLIVAVPGTPGFAELCAYIGALMPVDGASFPIPSGVRLIAPPVEPAPEPDVPAPTRASMARARAIAAENDATRRRRRIAIATIVGAVAVVIGSQWKVIRPLLPAPVAALFTSAVPDSAAASLKDSAGVITPANARGISDSAFLADSARLAADSAAAREPLPVANPADSARSARFAIYFATANTREAAMPESSVLALPAVAMSPVPEGSELWYRVTVGASNSRGVAAAMLADLRARKVVGAGSVLSVPYALQLEDSVTAAAVPARLGEWKTRGIVAYALRQPNNLATIVTGAFESPKQANILADSLQRIGITPVLIYRTGRAF